MSFLSFVSARLRDALGTAKHAGLT